MKMKTDLKNVLTLILILTLVSVFLSGCGILSILRKTAGRKDDETQASAQPSETPADASQNAPEPEAPESASFPDGFSYTIIEHDANFSIDGDELATGVIHEIILPDEVASAFPKLSEEVLSINEYTKDSIIKSLQGMEEDALEMLACMGPLPFSDWRDMYPVRADDQAFSFVTCSSIYLGGAHPYSAFSSVNIDPKTGEKIPFSAVVKKTDGFADVCFDELLKQNDDLVEYFETCVDDKQMVLDDLNENFENDAENLAWALDYDGILIYYDDYGMGSYAAGAREEKIPFADHPEYFAADFMKEGTIPDITKQVTKEEGEVIEVPRGDHVIDVFYKQDYSYQDIERGYCLGILDAFDVSDEYDLLHKALESFNSETEKKNSTDFPDYVDEIKTLKEYLPDDDSFLVFTYGDQLALQRADTRAFSFYEYISRDRKGMNDNRVIIGHNFDTATGKELFLDDVITDKDMLLKALDVRLKEWDVRNEVAEDVRNEFTLQLKSGDLTSSDAFSWVLGYEGLTLYFNTSINYNVFSQMGGTFSFFIPFKEFPELFDPAYTNVNYAFAQDLVIGEKFSDYFYIDPDNDGSYTEVGIAGDFDEYGWCNFLEFGGEDHPYSKLENCAGTDLKGFLTKDSDGFYGVYIERGADDGFTCTDYYQYYDGKLNYQDSFSGSMRYCLYDFEAEKHAFGCTLSTPVRFSVSSMNEMIGLHVVTGDALPDYMGMPVYNGYLTFHPYSDEYEIEVKKELSVDIVDEEGKVLESGKLPKGTFILPYRCLMSDDPNADADDPAQAMLDLQDEKGTIYRLSLIQSAEDGIWKTEGKPVSDFFDNLPY